MRRGFRILAACLAVASAYSAESPTDRGRRALNEALQALGGDAFLKVRDRVETGRAYSFYKSELSGLSVAKIYTRYLKAPDPAKLAVRERESFFSKVTAKQEDAAVLFTEDGAWELTYRGALPLPDERYQNYRDATRKNIFYILRERIKEPGLEPYWMGSDVVDNQPVDVVEITDAANEKITVYFSKSDRVPLKQSFRRRNTLFKDYDTEVTFFGKFRDAGGGVKWPYNIRRERNGEKIYELYSESVQINQELTDDLFNLPVSMKILPKPK